MAWGLDASQILGRQTKNEPRLSARPGRYALSFYRVCVCVYIYTHLYMHPPLLLSNI